ncbi:hypothetical protein HYPSUDRAFT_37627 [Hypholoma sublateritium FD-334 SS-4]|uniref:DUF6534 domain-containing protein n=1 Tax=Hypholoma sublateritium (strain FD-334 SS-4) TaxID=945553 RepID=A0A0D2P3X8_HYPSF|nr:hypothetical protein HYPSUDRAFT_37627 [Hypholoma sublateritium FD-334 SS-4]
MSALFLFKLPDLVYKDITIILVGSLAHWMLYGVLLVQVCLYYAAFPKDPRLAKLTVLLALVLETAQTTMFTHDLFKGLTLGYENPLLVNEVDTVWFSVPLLTGLIALLTQAFYCYRTAILTKSKYAVAAIVILSILQVGAATAVAMQTREAKLLTSILGTEISLITIGIWGASGVGCDTTIAVIMVYHLKKSLDTGFQGTHTIVRRLIRLTIETGLVTASFSILTMVLAYLPGHPPYYQVAILILAKMYSLSMIAALNSRNKVISNSPPDSPPCWNESAKPMESLEMKSTAAFAFRRDESAGTMDSEV